MKFIFTFLAIISISIAFGNGHAISSISKEKVKVEFSPSELPNNSDQLNAKIINFFNSVFGNKIELVLKSNSQIVKGGITFVDGNQDTLPSGYKVFASVHDVSLADAPSKKLGEQIMTDATKFPIEFSIDIGDVKIEKWRSYSVQIKIMNKDDKLAYISDTYTPILDNNGELLDYPVLINVIKIEQNNNNAPVNNNRILRGFIRLFENTDPNIFTPVFLPQDSMVKVTVNDQSRQDVTPIVLGEENFGFNTIGRFPIEYKVQYNSEAWSNWNIGTYTVNVQIKNSQGVLIYLNNVQHLLTDDQAQLKSTLDIDVIAIPILYPAPVIEPVPFPVEPSLTQVIRGQVTCSSAKYSNNNKYDARPNGSLTVTIQDISRMDAPAKQIAGKTMKIDEWSFPLNYEIEFDASHILGRPWGTYSISASISDNNGRLVFISDTMHSIKKDQIKFEIKSQIDVNVIDMRRSF